MEELNRQLIEIEQGPGIESIRVILKRRAGKALKLDNTADFVNYFREVFDDDRFDTQEQAVMISLDEDNRVIAPYVLHIGESCSCNIDKKLIIRIAAMSGASSVVLAHNHPETAAVPSDADIDATQAIYHALRIAGFALADSLIITRNSHYSLDDNGLI